MRSLAYRYTAMLLVAAFLALSLVSFQTAAMAQGEEDSLQMEADHLTYEIIELKTRRKKAESDYAAIRGELDSLDGDIASSEVEIQILEEELALCQKAYNSSVRSLYKRGDITELEVFLEAREFEELWEDITFYEHFMESEGEVLDDLKDKLETLEIKKRDLKEARLKRERLVETLDIETLDKTLSELEASLSEINNRLRALKAQKGEARSPAPDPPSWTPPPPGKLLDRVPVMPPLSDFDRTGMTYSGYTTSYGADFHGRSTASGVIFNMYDYTCAHKTMPFGTWLLVTFQGKQVIVQVNDRGPFVPGRVLDLSYGAAQSVGLNGVQWTDFEILIPRGG